MNAWHESKEDPVSVYTISLFLHIVGALGLFAVLSVEWAGLAQLRRAAGVAQARESARLLAGPRAVGGPASLLILVTGIHMTATRWGPQGWIVVGLAGMVIIAVLSIAVSGRRTAAIARVLPTEDGPIPAAVRQRLQDPVLPLALRVRTALFLGVVFLMATEPGTGISLTALAVAAIAGVAAALAAREEGDHQARAVESQP
jgi:hypothetical protein